METCKNLIGGEWVGAERPRQLRDEEPGARRRGPRRLPQRDRRGRGPGGRCGRRGVPGLGGPRRRPPAARSSSRRPSCSPSASSEVARTLTREEGKTLAEATGEVARARDILRYFGGEGWRAGGDVLPPNAPHGMLFSRREPLGVVAAITPWNFPIAIPAWKIAPALVYGNAVVFKPAVGDAAHGASPGRVPRGRRPAGRRPQPRHRLRLRGRRRPGRRPRRARASPSRGRTTRARASTRARRGTSRASSSRWAARTRRSCSTTPTWGWPSGWPSWAASRSPARAARPPAA